MSDARTGGSIELTKGILRENPVFAMVLGLCPALAVSTQVVNALGMGVATLFVVLGSNVMVSLLKDFIPAKARIPAYIVIIASFVTIVELSMKAYAPELARNLGVFLQLIVVNCMILGRAEAFASKKTLGDSVLDAIGMGVGFTLALTVIAFIRETLGAGTLALSGLRLELPWSGAPVRAFALPAGALLVIGYLKALFNWYQARRDAKEQAAEAAAGADAPAVEVGA